MIQSIASFLSIFNKVNHLAFLTPLDFFFFCLLQKILPELGWRPVGPSEHKQATRKKTAAPKYLDKKVDPEKHSGCTRRSGLKLEPEVCVVAPPASPKIGGAASPLYLPQAVHEADTGTPASPAFRRVDSSSLIAWRTHLDFRASLTSSTCNASHLGPEKKPCFRATGNGQTTSNSCRGLFTGTAVFATYHIRTSPIKFQISPLASDPIHSLPGSVVAALRR